MVVRLDQLLVERGLVGSRELAKARIMAGEVFSGDQRLDKSGLTVPKDLPLEIRARGPSYVGFGGEKLERALHHFQRDVLGKVVLDVGASTGGFTDCLLSHGAKKVYAYDVGYGQLDPKLRGDPRVVVVEKRNVRYLRPEEISEPLDLACVDVSFISLCLVLPPIARCLRPKGEILALVKPQFELEKGEVGKGGIVRDPLKRERAIRKIELFSQEQGWIPLGRCESPMKSSRGNVEVFLLIQVGGDLS
ncbi:MAG: TlyA family RNA methyltransferase [Deltaproteobacteria bacterium]|nr:TlyA family RNA methyltransferase [Deltaproteobacteria bacterium]